MLHFKTLFGLFFLVFSSYGEELQPSLSPQDIQTIIEFVPEKEVFSFFDSLKKESGENAALKKIEDIKDVIEIESQWTGKETLKDRIGRDAAVLTETDPLLLKQSLDVLKPIIKTSDLKRLLSQQVNRAPFLKPENLKQNIELLKKHISSAALKKIIDKNLKNLSHAETSALTENIKIIQERLIKNKNLRETMIVKYFPKISNKDPQELKDTIRTLKSFFHNDTRAIENIAMNNFSALFNIKPVLFKESIKIVKPFLSNGNTLKQTVAASLQPFADARPQNLKLTIDILEEILIEDNKVHSLIKNIARANIKSFLVAQPYYLVNNFSLIEDYLGHEKAVEILKSSSFKIISNSHPEKFQENVEYIENHIGKYCLIEKMKTEIHYLFLMNKDIFEELEKRWGADKMKTRLVKHSLNDAVFKELSKTDFNILKLLKGKPKDKENQDKEPCLKAFNSSS